MSKILGEREGLKLEFKSRDVLDDLAKIRDSRTGLLPRYLNVRCRLENNTQANPATEPSMRSMAIIMRMGSTN